MFTKNYTFSTVYNYFEPGETIYRRLSGIFDKRALTVAKLRMAIHVWFSMGGVLVSQALA